MHKSFYSMTKAVFANFKDQLSILDLKTPCLTELRNTTEGKQSWLHLLCRPNFENLPTALHVEAIPQYESCSENIDNDQEESKEVIAVAEPSESQLTRDSLIKSVNDAF